MNIGILKESNLSERRVALSPAGVQSLVASGQTVHVERQAGALALFNDDEYIAAGATIVYSAEEIINRSEVVLKISPPTENELQLLVKGQAFFSSLHLALSKRKEIELLLHREVTAIAYELIENAQGDLAVLQVMSEIGGQISMHVAAHYLQGEKGGRGILLGCIPGVPPASVVILGAGTVGRTAARIAIGMGASVSVLDRDISRLRQIEELLQWKVATAIATSYNIRKAVRYADVVIGAVLLKGEKAPHIVTEEMVKEMKAGSVIVDVSIDQGGCIETSRPTTIEDPVFVRHGVVHYCVPNMPATVARTATAGLTNALLPYIQEIAEFGIDQSLRVDAGLAKGVCTYAGYCTNGAVGRVFDLQPGNLIRLLSISHEPSRN